MSEQAYAVVPRPVYTVHNLVKFGPLLTLAWLEEQIVYQRREVSTLVEYEHLGMAQTLESLLNDGYIDIDASKGVYTLTQKGLDELQRIDNTRQEIAQRYFVWDGVHIDGPTKPGADPRDSFAFRQFFDYRSDTDWRNEVRSNPKYRDLRLTVLYHQSLQSPDAEFSVLDALFCVFLVDRKFSLDRPDWSMNVIDGSIWNDLLGIANTFIVPGQIHAGDESTIRNIIDTGYEVAKELRLTEERLEAEARQDDPEHNREYFTNEVGYYEVEEEWVETLPDSFYWPIGLGFVGYPVFVI